MTQLKYKLSAAIMAGLLSGISDTAFAQQDFGDISENITESISDVPGLVSGVSYLVGTLLGVLGVMKIKDHVENPTQTALKDGAIRLAAGGGLFALPIIYEAMTNTIGNGNQAVQPTLNAVQFSVN